MHVYFPKTASCFGEIENLCLCTYILNNVKK